MLKNVKKMVTIKRYNESGRIDKRHLVYWTNTEVYDSSLNLIKSAARRSVVLEENIAEYLDNN